MVISREQLFLDTLTFVADTLIDDFDVADYLHELAERCAGICDATAVTLTLAPTDPELAVVAATHWKPPGPGTPRIPGSAGPDVDALVSGEVITASTLEEMHQRWPAFTADLQHFEIHSVHVVPLRLRQSAIGSLTFLRDRPGTLEPADSQAAQTIANLATIGLIHKRIYREGVIARDTLQHALDARIIIEQAKGVIAHSRSISMDWAWMLLTQQARQRNLNVTDLARGIIDRRITL